MLSFVLVVVVSQQAPAPLRIASRELTVTGLPADRAEIYTEHFGAQLALLGAQVTTPKEIQTLLGIERQRQLMGCSDESTSCMTELADALGADATAAGGVALVDGQYQVSVKLLDARSGRLLAGASARVKSESKVIDALTEAARALMGEASRATRREWVAPPKAAPLRVWSVIPAAGALAVGGLSALFFLQAKDRATTLQTRDPIDLPEARQLRDQGKQNQLIGGIMIGVGVACLAAASALFVYRGALAEVELIPAAGSGGGALMLGGTF